MTSMMIVTIPRREDKFKIRDFQRIGHKKYRKLFLLLSLIISLDMMMTKWFIGQVRLETRSKI